MFDTPSFTGVIAKRDENYIRNGADAPQQQRKNITTTQHHHHRHDMTSSTKSLGLVDYAIPNRHTLATLHADINTGTEGHHSVTDTAAVCEP